MLAYEGTPGSLAWSAQQEVTENVGDLASGTPFWISGVGFLASGSKLWFLA
jgi:hypothetical protein